MDDNEPEDLDWLDEDTGGGGTALDIVSEDGEPTTKAKPPSPWAVKLDPWGKRKGRDILKSEEFKQLGNVTEEEAADMYAMSFEYDPQLEDVCADKKRQDFLKALKEDPDYNALHATTQFDTLASELAAYEFAKKYKTYVAEREKEEKQNPQKGDKPQSPQEELRQELKAAVAASQAAKAAAEEVKEMQDTREALGAGSGGGGDGKMSAQQVRQIYNKVKGDAGLRRICELAGKYMNVCRAKQRNKTIHGYDDLVGVMLDNDPSLLLPIELAMFGIPGLEADSYRRFAERQLMCDEYQAVEKVAKGPFIVSVDESGSMDGERIWHAKAICLTMARLARTQNRWCGLHAWADNRRKDRILALPPKAWNTAEVMAWLTGFINGGTMLPIAQIPEIYKQLGAAKGKTDVIIITDGDTGTLAPDAIGKFKAWKKEATAKVIGISIASDSRGLRDVSDEYHQISSLSVNNEAVGEVLSL